MKQYDIIIIGGGSAGLGAIGMAQDLNWKPLLIDKDEAHIGGDCLNFGCVPSKALIHLAKYFYGAKQAAKYGLKSEGKADMKSILAYVHSKQAVIREHENADYFRAQGVDIEIGTASFVNEDTLSVNGQEFTAPKIIIATGSKPRMIPFKGLDQVNHFTNETLFYKMDTLPKHLLVVGGGPIGCEMGQVFRRFGSEVTILERSERILSVEREDASAILSQQFEKEGINILTQSNLLEFTDAETALVELPKGNKSISFDAVLLSVGRVLNHDSLKLEAGGIEVEKGKIVLNDYLQTSNKKVFVAGDAAGMYKFSHGAEKHIKLIHHNFKHPFTKKKHSSEDLSWATFTDPEVASFGYTEPQLWEQNIKYWRQDQVFNDDDRAIVGEFSYGKITLFVSEPSVFRKHRCILGGTIVAPNAGEIMQELLLAANTELPLKWFTDKIYAYPVASRINQQAIKGILNKDK